MAEALVWQLIRTNNSFLVKRGRTKRDGSVQFSKDSGNILAVNSFKFSGIANNNTVNLSVEGAEIKLTKKSDKDLNKPSKSYIATTVSSATELESALVGYRADIASVVLSKFSKLQKSLKKAAPKVAKTNSRALRKAKRSAK